MSAGEFFDLVRPAFLILSALLSSWIFANAQRNGFRAHRALLWALAALVLPLVIIPLYLLVRFNQDNPRRVGDATANASISASRRVRWRFLFLLLYATTILGVIAIFHWRDFNSIDAHLARATQAKVTGNRERAIREYKAALALEDDAHTHKLLAIELSETGDWTSALSEYRLAERNGEPDPSLPFRIAALLDLLNQHNQAVMEYKRFVYSEPCLRASPDYRCEVASQRMNK